MKEGDVIGSRTVLLLRLAAKGRQILALCFCNRCEELSWEAMRDAKNRKTGCKHCGRKPTKCELGEVVGMFKLLSRKGALGSWICVQCGRRRDTPIGPMRQHGGNCAACNPRTRKTRHVIGSVVHGRTFISRTSPQKSIWRCNECGTEKELWGAPRTKCDHKRAHHIGDTKYGWTLISKNPRRRWRCKICGRETTSPIIPKQCLHGGIPPRQKPGEVGETSINGWLLLQLRVVKTAHWKHLWRCETCDLERVQSAARARYRACKHRK